MGWIMLLSYIKTTDGLFYVYFGGCCGEYRATVLMDGCIDCWFDSLPKANQWLMECYWAEYEH